MHKNIWISGSIYINIPLMLMPDRGNIIVCIDDEDYLTGENKRPKRSVNVFT